MIICTMPGCQTTAGCRCTGLVWHQNPEKFAVDPEFYPKEVARLTAALEAAQARIEAVRRETVEECANVIGEHVPVLDAIHDAEFADGFTSAKRFYIGRIRALTEAKEDRT